MTTSPSAVLIGALLAAGCGTKAGLVVTVEGSASEPVASLLAQGRAADGGWMDESVFGPPSGETEITLPATFGIELTGPSANLDGDVEVCVTARDAAEVDLTDGCATESVARGEITDFLIVLGGEVDAGLDSGLDAGVDGGTDAGACGDGVRGGSEDCDGTDLGGADCVSLGFSGGALDCDATCTFDVAMCAGPPTVPVLRLPMNGAYVGSVHVSGSLAPAFVWEPSLVGGGASITYELEYGTDSTFSPPLTTMAMTTFPNHQPSADLVVSVAPPVGARYFWHVRACAGASCSDYSPTWIVNVGRSDRDVNGDGYADLIVGAYWNDAGGSNAGRAYVYLGGAAGVDPTADTTLTGEASVDRFGISVASAGDVNADGYADIVVGASLHDAGGSNAGRAYVYLGGMAGIATTSAVTLDGEAAEDQFGRSVASAGDVNADGYADIVIGALDSDLGGVDAGSAYVFLGDAAGVATTPAATLVGEATGDGFGVSVASAGDVDGDGYADLIVGAYHNDAAGGDAGRVYVYRGGVMGVGTAAATTLTGEAAGDAFGRPVAPAGDVNGDGYADVIVGARFNSAGGFEAGRAYVYLGGTVGVATTPAATLTGEAAGDQFGTSVASAGDVNADGHADVIVGGYLASASAAFAGRGYVYFGGPGPSFDATAEGVLDGEAAGDGFGISVASAGDVDGDGFADVIVGAYANDAGGMDAGRAYVYSGGAAGVATMPAAMLTGEAADDLFGYSVASVWGLPNTGADAPRALAPLCDPDA